MGMVLSHVRPNGTERPVAYTLQEPYPQPSEIISSWRKRDWRLFLVLRIKFHNYLYGQQFTIELVLSHLYSVRHVRYLCWRMASSRIQRWALTLQYNIRYKVDHPSTNGLAERAVLVQTVKQGLRHMQSPGTVQEKLAIARFLHQINSESHLIRLLECSLQNF